jgi:hypothetical protein
MQYSKAWEMNTKSNESEASAAEQEPVSSVPAFSPVIYRLAMGWMTEGSEFESR